MTVHEMNPLFLCDGGGTFIGVAEELKKHNCGKLFLFVTHGIFSR